MIDLVNLRIITSATALSPGISRRGARERSGDPSHSPSPGSKVVKDQLDAAIDALENRMTSTLSCDFHGFA